MASKIPSEAEINGMAVDFGFAGKDKDGDTKVSLTVLLPNGEKAGKLISEKAAFAPRPRCRGRAAFSPQVHLAPRAVA